MRGKHLLLTSILLLPTLAHASPADLYDEEQPLTDSTSLSGRALNGDTEVLTPKGILSEESFDAAQSLPGDTVSPLEADGIGIPGDSIDPSAGGEVSPLFMPDAPGAEGERSGTASSAVTVAAPPRPVEEEDMTPDPTEPVTGPSGPTVEQP
jgi:hypothetical protein